MNPASRTIATGLLAMMMSVAQNAFAQAGAHSDAAFVRDACAAGTTEVQASQLALTQARNPALQGFAATMVQDHSASDNALRDLAQRKGYHVPAGPTPTQQKNLDALKSLHGDAFDARYAQMMLQDHHQAVALFSEEASHGQDTDLKVFASKTLPTLQQHLSMAQALPQGK
jgi:putative membrane protein